MKSGASDPFADDVDDVDDVDDADYVDDASEEPEEQAEDEEVANETDGEDEADASATAVEESMDEGSADELSADDVETVEEAAEDLADEAVDDELDGGEIERSDIPWVLRRDAVKDDRPHVHQLFVREDTDGKARRAESRLEERLDTDVYRLDAREAIYLVGMRHLDEVTELLEGWGYDL
jgi:hypothetical protein